jgi:hypothetical protein
MQSPGHAPISKKKSLHMDFTVWSLMHKTTKSLVAAALLWKTLELQSNWLVQEINYFSQVQTIDANLKILLAVIAPQF